ALPALGLVGKALLQDLLIFRRQRRLLPAPPGLGLIERSLAAEPPYDEPRPCPFPVGIVRRIGRLRAGTRDKEYRCEDNRCDSGGAPVGHDPLRSLYDVSIASAATPAGQPAGDVRKCGAARPDR